MASPAAIISALHSGLASLTCRHRGARRLEMSCVRRPIELLLVHDRMESRDNVRPTCAKKKRR
jgi:hypothetical protein